jgi:hypothetical protein
MATMKKSTQVALLVAALAAGALAAVTTRTVSKANASKHASESNLELAAAANKPNQATNEAPSLEGSVLETIQVSRYTYLRIGASGQPGTWAAVSSAPEVKVGDSVRVLHGQIMENFKSTALNRTFDKIYFGVLDDGKSQAAAGSNPHAGIDMSNPHAAASAGVPGANPDGVNPHAQVAASAQAIPVAKVAKAKGELGYTVADIFAKRSALSGKLVRVRAVVVKTTSGVMGKTFLHVRDGSGSEKTNDFDLAITTQEQPQLSDTLLFEGKLGVDVDFGAGYKYPVIIQDARLVTD